MMQVNANAILCSDLHFRDDVPECRTDDYWAAQERKLDFILALQDRNQCPVLVGGDFFDKAKSSPFLEAWLIKKLGISLNDNTQWFVVPGQHDMPNHREDLLPKSSLGVLHNAEAICVLSPYPHRETKGFLIDAFSFGHDPKPDKNIKTSGKRVCMAHHLVGADFPGNESETAREFLRHMRGYDLVLTGDNHRQFAVEEGGRWLVNPGSMMRMKSDQANHRPAVYLWYAEGNRVERVPLPIEQGVISREHIEKQERRDERIDLYVDRLGSEHEIGLSYRENLKKKCESRRIKKPVKDRAWEAVEGGIA